MPEEFGLAPAVPVDPFRVKYLQRLSYEGIWVPASQRPPKYQTIIIFDWDDTLLPTTFLEANGEEISSGQRQTFELLQAKVVELLEAAIAKGKVFLITNAMVEWITYSAEKYMPEVLPVLKKLKVISARDKYEKTFPNEMTMWKSRAFMDLKKRMWDGGIVTNLLCLGDSVMEMEAVDKMSKQFTSAVVKTVKLREGPTPPELLKQLSLISDQFEAICNAGKNMTLALEKKWTCTPARAGAAGSLPMQQAMLARRAAK